MKLFQKQFILADRLDQVVPAIAKALVRAGGDRVQVWGVVADAASLKPSQDTLLVPKAVAMALNMLHKGEVGGDLGAFFSSDGYIMDGHHRWAATILAGGATVSGYRAALPGSVLLRVLNLVAKGELGVTKGKPGEGSLRDFTPLAVAREVVRCAREGVGGDYPLSPAEVRAALGGSAVAGARAFARNVQKMHREPPRWAPSRDQMPVIEPEDLPAVSDLLNGGLVNWKPPYRLASTQKGKAMGNDKKLRSDLIRLAARSTPEVRKALLPLLSKRAGAKTAAPGGPGIFTLYYDAYRGVSNVVLMGPSPLKEIEAKLKKDDALRVKAADGNEKAKKEVEALWGGKLSWDANGTLYVKSDGKDWQWIGDGWEEV